MYGKLDFGDAQEVPWGTETTDARMWMPECNVKLSHGCVGAG